MGSLETWTQKLGHPALGCQKDPGGCLSRRGQLGSSLWGSQGAELGVVCSVRTHDKHLLSKHFLGARPPAGR